MPSERIAESTGPHIIHFVGQLTPVVSSYLIPAANALARAGFTQTIVLVAPDEDASITQRLPPSVKVEFAAGHSRNGRWAAGLKTLGRVIKQRQPSGIHMHGFVAFLLGGVALRRFGYAGNLFYSPHGSRAHSEHSMLGSIAYALVSPWIGGRSFLVIADETGDPAGALPGAREVLAEVPTPVDEAFFALKRIEAPLPLVAGGASDTAASGVANFREIARQLRSLPNMGEMPKEGLHNSRANVLMR